MALKVLAVFVADFILLRIWAPDLVNLHADWALGLAIVCLLIALSLTVWLVLDVRRGLRKSRAANQRAISSPRPEQENP